MAERFYLPYTGAAGASPAYDSAWEVTTFAARLKAVITKISSTMTTVSATVSSSTAEQHLYRQHVSDPIAAQTILAQTIKFQIRGVESSAKADLYSAICIRVVSNDGGTVRGTILALANGIDDTEFATSLTNRQFSATSTQVVAEANDRIVIETGQDGSPWGSGNHNDGGLSYGDDSGTDLGENDSDTAAYNPWVEFANDISWPSGTQYQQAVAGTLVTSGVPTKQTQKPQAGTLSSSGTITRVTDFVRSLGGALATTGTIAKSIPRALGGTLATTGTAVKKIPKALAGLIEFKT